MFLVENLIFGDFWSKFIELKLKVHNECAKYFNIKLCQKYIVRIFLITIYYYRKYENLI